MARHFTRASNHVIEVAAAGLNFTGDTTCAAIVKKSTDAIAEGIFAQQITTTHWRMDCASSNKLNYRQGDAAVDIPSPTITLTVADGWALVALSKATGTTAPRFHKYLYSSNAWTHENGASTVADPASPGTTACRIGGGAGSSLFWDGEIALVGVWNAVLTDAQIETMPFLLPSWLQVTPKGLWLLDQQAVTMKVNDLHGGGNDESARVGTTISTSSVPLLSYGHRPALDRQPAAVVGTRGPLDLLLTGAG